MTREEALQLMQESFDSLHRSAMIPESISVTPDIVILGSGSFLDSLGFVTFISDLEERICQKCGADIFLVLTEIHGFNADQSYLSAATLSAYIESITK